MLMFRFFWDTLYTSDKVLQILNFDWLLDHGLVTVHGWQNENKPENFCFANVCTVFSTYKLQFFYQFRDFAPKMIALIHSSR